MNIRPVGAQAVPCGWADTRTDKYEEANSRFSQFCERALKAPVTFLVVCSCYLFDIFTAAFYIPRPTPSTAKLTTRHAMSEVDGHPACYAVRPCESGSQGNPTAGQGKCLTDF
jgi:hypothetical protein